ncbi:response regulator transcription factor [Ramlibacter henchirensis]|uniref:Response regulator transcription factor n=1 Tax=Ramlibacter henchirensis TaxID=204072 RepID=A0A4Z0BVJ1_9BURK|nr:response regulator transcription factor [Ramlibacter henchirensis]TFZ02484.1 response regulator transcription factor [Ramlibacter henchirensis]
MLTQSRPFDAELPRFDPPGVKEAGPRRILLVDDHALVRMSVVNVCASAFKDVEVLEATSLAAALALYERFEGSIQLVLLDLNLPDSKGFASLLTLKRRFPRSRILVLSGAFDDAVAAEACVLGAEKFLHKGADRALLAATLSDLLEPMFQARRDAAAASASTRRSPSAANTLSPREIEILDLVLQGKTNQEIVVATGLKLGTVKNYISGLFVVFGVPSRSKLVSLFV